MAKPSRLGRRVKAFRLQRNMTQEELRQASGISRAVIAGLESGLRQSVMLETVEKLARALHTDLNQLTGFDALGDVDEIELVAASA